MLRVVAWSIPWSDLLLLEYHSDSIRDPILDACLLVAATTFPSAKLTSSLDLERHRVGYGISADYKVQIISAGAYPL